MMSVTTLTENLLKRNGRPRAAIRGNPWAGKWARMAILEYTGS